MKMKDYHNFYLKCNVLLLADIFEKCRYSSLRNYGLCPSHYFECIILSSDAMLNIRKVVLELNSDPDMILFFKKGMRGRVPNISK